MNPEEIKKKIQEARNQGVPDSVTFKYLNDRGLIPKDKIVQAQAPVQEEQPGGFQSFVQSIAKPVLKIASSARSIGDIAAAKSNAEVDIAKTKAYDYGYFGKVAGLQNPIESIGVGAEIGSYALGGGGAAKTLVTGLKGKVLQGTYQGLKTGAVSGGTMSFGQALQEADVKPSDVAYKTLFGTAVGAGAGLTLGAIAPVAVKSIGGVKNTVKRFTNVNEINTELQNLNTQAFKPTPKQVEKWSAQGKDPMKTYTEIFGTDIPEVGKDNRFTRGSISDAVQRVDDLYKPAAEGFNTILKNSPEVNSISKARDMAVKNLDEFNLTPDSYNRAVAKIDNEFNAIKNEAAKTGQLLGDDSIPVAYSDNLKDRFWSATKNFGTEDATIANSVNSSIGHGFKDSIENSIQDINVKNYNKQLGDLIVLRDFLETKVGALPGTGGKATRLMSRVAGAVIGAKVGPIGSFIGSLTGDKLAQVMINPAYQPYRWLINKKLQQLPQAQILKLTQEANAVIESMLQKRMSRLALPEGAKLGTTGNPIITPNTFGTPNPATPMGKSAVAIASNQPQRASATIEPTTKPNMIVPNKANIDKSLPFNKGFIKGADGGQVKKINVDDKRVMKDFTDYVANEMGNLTGKEIQELELAASRIAERYNIKNFKTIKGLANEFGRILDDQGLDFGKIAANPLVIGAGLSAVAVTLSKLLKKKKK